MKKKIKPTSFRPRGELLEKIDSVCEKLDCSRNDYINTALESAISEDIEEENSQDQEESKKPQLIKVEDVIEFECKNGNLYENGSLFGSCSNYDLDQGKVYEKNGKYLGQIKNDSKPQIVEIPHATIKIIE